jgi:hypothetical protein
MTVVSRLRGIATLVACVAASVVCAGAGKAQVNVTTYHNDSLRTGWNSSETTLTQSNVTAGSFGILKTVSLDDQVDAEPLLVNGLTINGGKHNVVYVATENNSIYAIDGSNGQVLLQTNLGAPVSYLNLPGECNNNGPNVGINSTPVIDPKAGVLYVIAYNWQNNAAAYYLHELSLTTLQDVVTPMAVSASGALQDGSTYQFNATVNRQRSALLLANGNIYAGFASFCDADSNQSRGWLLGWQAGALTPLASNKLTNTRTTSKNTFFLSSIWMSGFGLASGSSGSIYFVTGNSDYKGNSYNKVTNIAESAAAMSPDLSTMVGLYTPHDHRSLDQCDCDFGSGGLMLLPNQPGRFPHLAAAAGKETGVVLLDADDLHKVFGSYFAGSCWCGPSYYQGSDGIGRIVTSGGTSVDVWQVAAGRGIKPSMSMQSQYNNIANGQDWGFFTSVSSNGTTAGSDVVWAVGRPTDNNPANVDLYAVNPDNGQLLFSEVAGQWPNTGGNSNIVPMVANGMVYVASDQMLTIFGLGGSHKAALPKIHYVDMRPSLSPGQHDIYGTVLGVTGHIVSIRERNGGLLKLDVADALRNADFIPPQPGHAVHARGSIDAGGTMHADVILHAKDRPAMWPGDR